MVVSVCLENYDIQMKDRLNLRVFTTRRSTDLEEENGKMVALQIAPKIESLYGLGRQATNYKGL